MAKVIYVDSLIFGYGFAIGQLAVVSRESKNLEYVVAHELVHCEQFKEHGFFKFIWMYILELIENGYENNAFEIEARKLGAERSSQSTINNKRI